jgi:hypothetical protein
MYDTNLFEAILRELLLPSGVWARKCLFQAPNK